MATTGNCVRCGRHANLDRKSRCATCRKELAKALAAKARHVALSVVALAAFNLVLHLLGQPKTVGGELGMLQRLATVRACLSDLQAQEDRQPKGLTEIAQLITEAGFAVPILLPPKARPMPNAVVVDIQKGKVVLGVTTDSGQLLKRNGVPVAIEVP